MSEAITTTAGPREAAALWSLGLLGGVEIVRLCERWLVEDLDKGSSDVAWIASETSPTLSELATPFERSLRRLAGDAPSTDDAARLATYLYVSAIAEGRTPPFEGMEALINDLEDRFRDRKTPLIHHPDRDPMDRARYAGEVLGIQHLHTWHRELSDAADGSDLFYYNDLPRDEQLVKFEEELRAAAARLVTHLEPIVAAAVSPGA